ncbi:hypothetical protein E2C01_084735 [Portunus trituberculatus]|uniref:Uncharacterized protein n=1 Tax=Portunus trituberculatus TaxID=210409 RepID=A0A5B7J4T2_PORTR|nr:hypothetical protein [Portunus trituberculatus]
MYKKCGGLKCGREEGKRWEERKGEWEALEGREGRRDGRGVDGTNVGCVGSSLLNLQPTYPLRTRRPPAPAPLSPICTPSSSTGPLPSLSHLAPPSSLTIKFPSQLLPPPPAVQRPQRGGVLSFLLPVRPLLTSSSGRVSAVRQESRPDVSPTPASSKSRDCCTTWPNLHTDCHLVT